jgi:hypothetical protein
LKTQGIELIKLGDQEISELKEISRNSIKLMIDAGKIETRLVDDLYRHIEDTKE